MSRVALAVLLGLGLLFLAAAAWASDVELTGAEGHPRERFPLAVWAQSFGDATLDGAVRRAIEDWNAVTREALGLTAFTLVGARDTAEVTIAAVPKPPSGLMGVTELSADDSGVITLPVRIMIVEPAARGQTSRETLLYQVVAHELGHALGLPHVRDPRSLMCCVKGSVDFNDAATREAYVEARRHPDVRSVRAELTAQYARVWRQ